MATRKGIKISVHYVVSINALCLFIYLNVLCILKLKGRTGSYFILFLNPNDPPTRCFNFGLLRRVHPNGGNFELNFKKANIKQSSSKN